MKKMSRFLALVLVIALLSTTLFVLPAAAVTTKMTDITYAYSTSGGLNGVSNITLTFNNMIAASPQQLGTSMFEVQGCTITSAVVILTNGVNSTKTVKIYIQRPNDYYQGTPYVDLVGDLYDTTGALVEKGRIVKIGGVVTYTPATPLVTVTASENAADPLSFVAAGEGKTFSVTTVGSIDSAHPITLNVTKQGGASWLSLSQSASQYTAAGGITVTATAAQNTGSLRTETLNISFSGDTGYYNLPSNLTVAISQAPGIVAAFPGAEGFGKFAIGGRGGDVYYVTNLNDTGAGSLRNGITGQTGARTIVFAIGGTISLQTQLKILKENLTIAGQTAPGDGITLKNFGITIQADDTIVRYVRSRVGDLLLSPADAISIGSGQNVIVDHCSASWALDETISTSFWTSGSTYTVLDKVTVQWCIISEPCDHNPDYDSTRAGKGSLINAHNGAGITYHHNLYASVADRAPRIGSYYVYATDPIGPRVDFRNNVVFNYNTSRPGYASGSDHAREYSMVKNYYKAGSNSPTNTPKIGEEYSPYADVYANGNSLNGTVTEGATNLFKNWSGVATWLTTEPNYGSYAVTTETAANAYTSVLTDAGASKVRDAVDNRIISEVQNGTGQIIVDQNAVGGWPTLAAGTAVVDNDADGMADSWETANGLSSSNAADRNNYTLSSSYTNLEMYLNSLV